LQAANRVAAAAHYDNRCTRFFPSGDKLVLVLDADCRRGHVVDDGTGIAVIGANGDIVLAASNLAAVDARRLEPFRRER